MMPLVCEEPVTRQAYALGAKFFVMPTGESIRLEWSVWIKTEPTPPKPRTSAMVKGSPTLRNCMCLIASDFSLSAPRGLVANE